MLSNSKFFNFTLLFIIVIFINLFPKSSYSQPSYAVAVKSPESNEASYLVEYNPTLDYTKFIGEIDGNIKAIAIDPSNGKIYTVKFNEFGTLSPINGAFEKISDLGSMQGRFSPQNNFSTITPDSIKCMTFDSDNNVILAVDYNGGRFRDNDPGTEDVLFKINPIDGKILSGMGDDLLSEFVGIPAVQSTTNQGSGIPPPIRDVWDISINPASGELVCYHRYGLYAFITILNAENGDIEAEVGDVSFKDYYGLNFSRDGNYLYFTTGNGFDLQTEDPSALWQRRFDGSLLDNRNRLGFIYVEDDLFYKTMDWGLTTLLDYAPCEIELDVTNMLSPYSAFTADSVINSNLYLTHETEFYAGEAINLESGFETKGYEIITNQDTTTVYHNFTAVISNCN